jgi:serine/threonine protein phosphatase PrpC
MRIVSFGMTDVGRRRAGNEDAFSVRDELGLYAVADGMGGHAAGEVASKTAVDTLCAFIESTSGADEIAWPVPVDSARPVAENRLVAGVKLANLAVFTLSQGRPELSGMGTTIVAALYESDSIYIAHVGDSRAYIMEAGRLIRVTTDHSYVEELVVSGQLTQEMARTHPLRNVITRAVGTKKDVAVDVSRHAFIPGSACLLCSDGLTGMLTDEQISEFLAQNPGNVTASVERLVDAANDAGGHDNITAVLIRRT